MDDQETMRVNFELAQRINREALADPSSPYAGKFVGIANGRVVVVGDDSYAALRRLLEIEPNNRRCCFFEASRDYSGVHHV
jgi:hypothetical protein